MIELVYAAAVLIGVAFMAVASLGVLRLDDFYARIHAPTKAATLGLAFLLLGFVAAAREATAVTKAVLCLLFIGVTAPVGAHVLSRAAYRSGLRPSVRARTDEYGERAAAERDEEEDGREGG